jgi:2-oxoglutarate ferredoxin oxidoreductase subunit delta
MSQVDRSPKPETAGASGSPKKKDDKSTPEILVKVSWCKGCGLCVEYCKRGVLEMDGVLPIVTDAEKCNRCLQCEMICPDFAIEVRDGQVELVDADGGDES